MTRPPPAQRIRREYAAHAAEYDRRWAKYVERSLALLRPFLAGAAPGEVLDLGCGTAGLLPRLRAWDVRLSRYVGVDFAPEMLAAGRERLPGALGAAALAAGAAEALPLRDASFDTVVSASSLHYWEAPRRVLAEVRRVLRPGGRLVLLDWSRDPPAMKLLHAAMRLARVRYRRMYSRAEAAALLEEAGFRVARRGGGSAGGLWRLMVLEAFSP
ncbi:MAG TPA: class I SAM-dependent methyltransferase [Longimicrobium sp.]|jgi:ubiquinone/menaquinone biosynthesis C-methylase UbiE